MHIWAKRIDFYRVFLLKGKKTERDPAKMEKNENWNKIHLYILVYIYEILKKLR